MANVIVEVVVKDVQNGCEGYQVSIPKLGSGRFFIQKHSDIRGDGRFSEETVLALVEHIHDLQVQLYG